MSLQRGPKRLLCEAVQGKPGLPWIIQNVEDARAVGYLLGRAKGVEPAEEKGVCCSQQS